MMSKLSELEKFYDQAWYKWGEMIKYSPAPRTRRRKVLSWIRDLNPQSVLDMGCGNGLFLSELKTVSPKVKLYGADISSRAIELNKETMPEADFFLMDLENHNLDRQFDAVVCMELIEHCGSKKALANLAAMTGKSLIITAPCGPYF